MDNKAVYLFQALHHASDTPEGKVLYILTLICLFMIVDFLTGTLAAWRNPKINFCSQVGINGILRKLASIIVLVCCIPLSALIPAEAGVAALVVLYFGYLLMEAKSIVENLDKLGVEISPLVHFLNKFNESKQEDQNEGEKK